MYSNLVLLSLESNSSISLKADLLARGPTFSDNLRSAMLCSEVLKAKEAEPDSARKLWNSD